MLKAFSKVTEEGANSATTIRTTNRRANATAVERRERVGESGGELT